MSRPVHAVRHDGPVAAQSVADQELIEACQTESLHLLERFSDTCQQHGWAFHLGAGTLLGAIRDGRFIPWDDDVDVTMPRADFDHLCTAASANPTLFGSDLAFDDGSTNRQFGRLNYLPSRAGKGHIHMDVFVLDTIPDAAIRRWIVEHLTWATRLALANEAEPVTDDARIRALASLTRTVGTQRVRAVYDGLLRYSRRHGDGSMWNCLNGSRPWGRARASAWYSGTRTADFEGRAYPVPEEAEAVLSTLYGPDFATPKPGHAQHYRRPLVAALGDVRWELR